MPLSGIAIHKIGAKRRHLHSSFLIMTRNHNKKYGDMVTFKSFPFPPIG